MSCLCDQCSALCCRYFVLEIDTPETSRQFDDVRWYMIHENTFVFIEKKKWYLGVYSRCKHLQLDNRCGIYETRPRICREYSTDNCDYHGGEYNWEVLFTSAEQLQEYAREKLVEMRLDKKRAAELEAEEAAKKKGKNKKGPPVMSPGLLLASGLANSAPPRNRNGKGREISLTVVR